MRVVFERYQNKVRLWLTFNEINCVAIGDPYMAGAARVRESEDVNQVTYQAAHHQFLASAQAVKLAHEKYPQFKVGMMLGGENFQSVSYSGENRSIYISPVDQALLLVQIFPGSKLPNRIEDFNRLLVEKLVDAVPAFTQNTSRLVR